MGRKWWLGVAAAFAVVCVAGVGFSAFTAVDTVSGSVSAGSVGLQIVAYLGHGCHYISNGAPGPGSAGFSGINAAQTTINFAVNGINLGEDCDGAIQLENSGTAPVNLTSGILFVGLNGICYAFESNCFDVATASGISASGLTCLNGSPTPCGTPAEISNNFATLNPGQSYTDDIVIDFAPGSNASAPTTGSFEIIYEATEIA